MEVGIGNGAQQKQRNRHLEDEVPQSVADLRAEDLQRTSAQPNKMRMKIGRTS